MQEKKKTCRICGETKGAEEFPKTGKVCRACCKVQNQAYYKDNRERVLEYQHRYYKENREKIVEVQKKYRAHNQEKNTERGREYRKQNREHVLEYQRRYHKENREKIVERTRQYNDQNREKRANRDRQYNKQNRKKISERARLYCLARRQTDLNYRLACSLRTRLYGAVRKSYKSGSAVRDLGCSISELKGHLSEKFYPRKTTGKEMSWENYGKDGWHIDHVVPLVLFDLTNRDHVIFACHYSNLQPLWAEENLSKNCKLTTGEK